MGSNPIPRAILGDFYENGYIKKTPDFMEETQDGRIIKPPTTSTPNSRRERDKSDGSTSANKQKDGLHNQIMLNAIL